MNRRIDLSLPYPPSANRYWRIFRGRTVKSAEAKAYQTEAGWLAKSLQVEPFVHDVELVLRVYRPRKSGDLDNRLKVLLDALQGIIYVNDNQVAKLSVERFDDKTNPRVELEITER